MSGLAGVRTVTKRELLAYFNSPVAYVFIVIFLLLAGFFTFNLGMFFERGEASLGNSFFVWHPWLYLFLVPAIGMRLWSEEQREGTMELLLTFPIAGWQAIVGKFLASWMIVILALVLTFPLVITVHYLGDPDTGVIWSGYFGSILLAGAYLAITCVTSASSRNQVVSFILAVVICLFLILAGFQPVTDFVIKIFPDSRWLVDAIANCSVMEHFADFQRGIITFGSLTYFVSLILFALFVTGVIVHGHRS